MTSPRGAVAGFAGPGPRVLIDVGRTRRGSMISESPIPTALDKSLGNIRAFSERIGERPIGSSLWRDKVWHTQTVRQVYSAP